MSQGKHFSEEPCPKIMKTIAKLLKDDGHSCPMIIGLNNHRFEWCQKDICPETKMQHDMAQRNQKQENFAAELISKGHKCVNILESYPCQVSWCNSEPCKKNEKQKRSFEKTFEDTVFEDSKMAQRNQAEEEFAEHLVAKGHKCVNILESYPCQVSWCNREPCSNK
jgi:hypothetical protein